MKSLLNLILLLILLPFLLLGLILGLFWHSFRAGVLYAEEILINATKKQ